MLGSDEALVLAGHLDRLLRWDPAAAVRVQLRGRALGIYAAPPTGCLVFLALLLADDVDHEVDRTVPASALRAALHGPGPLPLPRQASLGPGLSHCRRPVAGSCRCTAWRAT